MQVLPVGPHALLAEVDDAAQARALAAWVRGAGVEVREVVPAARTLLLDGLADPDRCAALLRSWQPSRSTPTGELVEIEVTYDGPDLAFVAGQWGTDEAGVVAAHAEVEYVAAFCGFAPGFAYLEGLDPARAVPRLDRPRPRVPAGAVALADTWCAVYPTASPGGWRVIGTTDAPMWDQDRDDPALLPPGTRVRFRDASSLGSSTQGSRDASSLGSSTPGSRDASGPAPS